MVDNDKIKQYIDLFDGDIVEAARALQRYASDMRDREVAVKSSPPPAGDTLISVDSLTKTYKLGKQTVEALRGVSLTIRKGEFVALTGPSGSGKSTLLQLIGGLDRPSSGKVIVGGVDLGAMNDRELSVFRNQTIGFVFQFFYLQPFLRLSQNLEVAGIPMRTPRSDRIKRVEELARIVGLGERLKHYPRELSGGQMQRAAIARALLNNPTILLADEPTGNLDSDNGRAVIDLFERIRSEYGMTVVVVTHDRAIARRADRIIELKDGRMI